MSRKPIATKRKPRKKAAQPSEAAVNEAAARIIDEMQRHAAEIRAERQAEPQAEPQAEQPTPPDPTEDVLNPIDAAIAQLLDAAESLCEGNANDAPVEVLQALGHLVTARRNVQLLAPAAEVQS
jgi:hypothetical protein